MAENLSSIKEWMISNLLWEILFGIVVFIFFKFLPRLLQVITITKRILKDNRDTRGNGLGKYMTDRFIDIWYSNEKKSPLPYITGKSYEKTFNNSNSRHHMDSIDRELAAVGLIEIFDRAGNYKTVRPIRNWRNSLIIKMTKFYLIHFVGDASRYYKNMDQQSKK